MKHNHWIAPIAAAAALLAAGTVQAVPAVVAPSYGPAVVLQSAPPAPVYEATPAPRRGYVWTPGHYEVRNGQYVWQSGHWIAARPGHEWEEARWVQRRDGSWVLTEGRWIRGDDDRMAYDDDDRHDRRYNSRRFGPNGDIDGDGILNRDDRDRDGDGIANRDDDFPNNPNRS